MVIIIVIILFITHGLRESTIREGYKAYINSVSRHINTTSVMGTLGDISGTLINSSLTAIS